MVAVDCFAQLRYRVAGDDPVSTRGRRIAPKGYAAKAHSQAANSDPCRKAGYSRTAGQYRTSPQADGRRSIDTACRL